MGRTLIRYHNISPEAIAALLVGGASVDPTNLKRDVAQTALTIASICRAGKRDMMGLMVDSFDTLDGIDQSRSSGYSHDSSSGRINGCLFYDDFSTQVIDTSKWQAISGTWVIENGELSGTAGTTQDYILSMTGWSDYTLTCDLWIKGPIWDAGLAFRAQDVNNHYLLAIDSVSSTAAYKLALYKRVGGTYTLLASAQPAIPDNTKTTVSIRVLGTNITAYINGTQMLTCSDSTYSSGKIGCRVYNGTHAHFDNLVVAGPGSTGNATVVSVPHNLSIAPTYVMLITEESPGSGTVTYYLSRDDGNTWTQVQPGVGADLSSQPPGNALRIKAELTRDAYIDGWALLWR